MHDAAGTPLGVAALRWLCRGKSRPVGDPWTQGYGWRQLGGHPRTWSFVVRATLPLPGKTAPPQLQETPCWPHSPDTSHPPVLEPDTSRCHIPTGRGQVSPCSPRCRRKPVSASCFSQTARWAQTTCPAAPCACLQNSLGHSRSLSRNWTTVPREAAVPAAPGPQGNALSGSLWAPPQRVAPTPSQCSQEISRHGFFPSNFPFTQATRAHNSLQCTAGLPCLCMATTVLPFSPGGSNAAGHTPSAAQGP